MFDRVDDTAATWPRSVIVDNRTGAAGRLAIAELRQAAPEVR